MTDTKLALHASTPLEAMREEAEMYIRSGIYPPGLDTPEKVIVLLKAAQDLGLQPTYAMRVCYVVGQRVGISGQGMLALALRSGLIASYEKDEKPGSVTVKISRREPPMSTTCTWDMERAKQAGLLQEWDRAKNCWREKSNWKKFPQEMLKWKAIAEALREVAPDAIMGLYLIDELQSLADTEHADSTPPPPPITITKTQAGEPRKMALPPTPVITPPSEVYPHEEATPILVKNDKPTPRRGRPPKEDHRRLPERVLMQINDCISVDELNALREALEGQMRIDGLYDLFDAEMKRREAQIG